MDIDINGIMQGLGYLNEKGKIALEIYADTAGKKLEADAKRNAKWTDRTGLSRKTMQGGKEVHGDQIEIYIAGNTSQMPFLELAHEKKYAILKPTVDKNAKSIIKGLENLLGK